MVKIQGLKMQTHYIDNEADNYSENEICWEGINELRGTKLGDKGLYFHFRASIENKLKELKPHVMLADQLAGCVIRVADELSIPCAVHCTFPWMNMNAWLKYGLHPGSGAG